MTYWFQSSRVLTLYLGLFLLSSIFSLFCQPEAAQAQWLDGSSSWLNTGGTTLYTQDNLGIGTTIPYSTLNIAGNGTNINGKGVIVGTVGDAIATAVPVGTETGRFEIGFPGWRDCEPNQIGAKIAAIRKNNFLANQAYIQSTDLAFFTGIGDAPPPGSSGCDALAGSFHDTSLERMRITKDGNVGIGTMAPLAKLDVSGTGNLRLSGLTAWGLEASENPAFQVVDRTNNVRRGVFDTSGNVFLGGSISCVAGCSAALSILGSGNIGIGTTTPAAKLQIDIGNSATASLPVLQLSGKYEGALWSNGGIRANGLQQTSGPYSGGISLQRYWYNGTSYGFEDVLNLTGGGNVGIGTTNPATKLHVIGDATFSGTVTGGNIKAQYQDVAEWVPSLRPMPAGTVVVLDRKQSNQVLPSSSAYDTRVAGVISAQPGLLLGVEGEGKVKVATTGRVKVKVNAGKGSIQVGDLLVTSEKEGIAMKSEPVEINGRPFHQPGTIIGKALEPLNTGEGEILVLLSLQ